MPDPLKIGDRATSRIMEAILLAFEEARPQGYV